MQPENIRSEQTVTPRMPVSRMSGIFGMIQNRDSQLFAADLTAVIHPRGSMAPYLPLAGPALGIGHETGAFRAGARFLRRLFQARRETDREGSLFGVAERNPVERSKR